MRKRNFPELLAPAGDLEKLKTAIDFGADAVYLAASRFGMRTASKNFTDEELEEGIRYVHAHGKHAYITLNILPHEDDLAGMRDWIPKLAALKPDAFIVSDPGVFSLAQELSPDIPLHISTQASVTNSGTVRFWKQQGAKRIVLARELSLEEIARIHANEPGMPLEAFVHGAMCISYSGRCLLSSYMTGRDANRGDCAHACRWNYALVERTRPDEAFEIGEDETGTYILNSKDLCLLPHLARLWEAGVTSFKIEGRVKSAFYVATVVRAYRLALDAMREDRLDESLIETLVEELKKCSHRAFTTAFAFGKPDETAQNYESAGYERPYDFVGVVVDVDEATETMIVSQRNRFAIGDTLEVLAPSAEIESYRVERMHNEDGEEMTVAPHPEQRLRLPLAKGAVAGAFLRRKGA